MLELQTAMFSELLDVPRCEECDELRKPKHRRLQCDRPLGLDRNGMRIAKAHGSNLVVSWPRCPRNWDRLRRLGADVVRIDDVASWLAEQEAHRVPNCPAHVSRLVRHYLRTRETPGHLKETRDAETRRLKKLALKGMR